MAKTQASQSNNLESELARLEASAISALQTGRESDAHALWGQVVKLMPGHARAHTQLGQFSFKQGDFQSARQSFLRVAELDGTEPRHWVNLALVAQRLGDEAAEEAALFRALTIDPYELLALLMRGALFERQGRTHEAARAFGAAATVAPSLDRLAPDLRNSVAYAMQFRDKHQQDLGLFLDAYLEPHLKQHSGAELTRFQRSVDLITGRRQRYDSQPMQYFVPDLLPVEFFDRSLFPWMDALEAGTADIRDEFMAVMESDNPDFVPYVRYAKDQPLAQWKDLNESLQWSVLHLVKDGLAVPSNAQRCPKTMELWSQVPSPDQPGRTPVALFSLLKPKTRIPPHVGASNARLLTHLPLIVPPGCGFRVGNTTREWVPGQAWVFDDSIEHEAWNESDALRVIMIFDIWHPHIRPEERALITQLSAALNAFGGITASGYGG